MRLACEKCGKSLEVPENSAGKTVQCPICKTSFRVPTLSAIVVGKAVEPAAVAVTADQPKTPALNKKPTPTSAKSPDKRRAPDPDASTSRGTPWLVWGLLGMGAVGVLMFFCIGVGGIIIAGAWQAQLAAEERIVEAKRIEVENELAMQRQRELEREERDRQRMREAADEKERAKKNEEVARLEFPPDAPRLEIRNGLAQVKAELTQQDARDGNRFTHRKVFLVRLDEGTTYDVQMKTLKAGFQPQCRIHKDTVNSLERNSAFPVASLQFTPKQTGDYQIVATTDGTAFGEFTLAIRDAKIVSESNEPAKLEFVDNTIRVAEVLVAREAKTYLVPLKAGTTYLFEADGSFAVNRVPPILTLMDDKLPLWVANSRPNDKTRFSFQAPRTHTYRLIVSNSGPAVFDMAITQGKTVEKIFNDKPLSFNRGKKIEIKAPMKVGLPNTFAFNADSVITYKIRLEEAKRYHLKVVPLYVGAKVTLLDSSGRFLVFARREGGIFLDGTMFTPERTDDYYLSIHPEPPTVERGFQYGYELLLEIR